MSGNTMSDWEKFARAKGLREWADRIHTDKDEDIKRLIASGLPCPEILQLPYSDFTKDNKQLRDWMQKYRDAGQGLCLRAIPTAQGYKTGYTRQPTRGFLTFNACCSFLRRKARGKKAFWKIIMNNWVPDKFGGVLASSGDRYYRGEIARNLERLTSGEENPLASFIYDRGGLGHMEDKTQWLEDEDKTAKEILWRTFFNHIKQGSDSFNPYLREGYFEFVVTRTKKVLFLDYKINPEYLR